MKKIILLDYDGTIVPIHPKPHLAKVDRDTKNMLEKLAKKHVLAIVTGRSFENFKGVFGSVPEDIYVITVHGAKIYKGENLIKDNSQISLPDLSSLEEALRDKKGCFLERKEGCFAVHFREYKGDEEEVKSIFYDFVKNYPPRKIIEGKKILEAVYGEFDKGKGVEDLLNIIKADGRKAIYIGDDTTDLYALKRIKELGGRSIFVGEGSYPFVDVYLKDYKEVIEFLRKLLKNSF